MNHDRFALRRLSRRVNLQSLVFSLLRGVFESTVQRLTEPHLPVHVFFCMEYVCQAHESLSNPWFVENW